MTARQVPTNAGIYARISADVAGEELGVKRQEKECRELAKRKGWRVGRVYVDNDISAFSGKRRPQFERMVADVKAGTIDGIVTYHIDRLVRRPIELEQFLQICEDAKLSALATCEGDIDLGSRDGQFMARVVGAVARKESDDKSRRLRSKHAELAAAGKLSGGGMRPFGFESDRLTIRPSEAEVIRHGVKLVLSGHSLLSVVKAWNKRGSVTSAGRSWYPSAVKRVLVSPRIAGLRGHHGEIAGKAVWPAVISASDSARIRAIMLDPRRRLNQDGPARKYLLSGIATCGLCGAKLVARPRGDGRRCMVCASAATGGKGCGKIRALAETLEAYVADQFIAAVDTPELARLVGAERKRLAADIRGQDRRDNPIELSAQLEAMAEDYAAGRITRGEWTRAREVLAKRLEAAQKAQPQGTGASAVVEFVGKGGLLRRKWRESMADGLEGLSRRRAWLSAIVEGVTVGPAVKGRSKFDPTRIAIEWRTEPSKRAA